MAQQAMEQFGMSIRLVCITFSISETCYRYQAKLSNDNALIADWLIRLTHNQKNWGFGLCYLFLRNVKGYQWNHKRISHLPGTGVEPPHQAGKANRAGKTRAIDSSGGNQRNLVDGFYA